MLVPESPSSSQGEPSPLLDDDTIGYDPPTSISNGEPPAKSSEAQPINGQLDTTSMDIEAEAQESVLSVPVGTGEGPADLEPIISLGGDECESRSLPLLEPAGSATVEAHMTSSSPADSLTAQPSPRDSPQSMSSSGSRSPLAAAAGLPSLQERPTEEPREQSLQPLMGEQIDAQQAACGHPSGLHITQRREAYLRRYLKDQYPIQLQTTILAFLEHGRYRPFYVGDFVEVRPRLQPRECKMGGLGYIKRAYTEPVHMYDVKYALGGLDKMVDGSFIISRMDDDSSTRQRKASPRCPGGCGAFAHECRCHARSSTRRRQQASGTEDDGRPALKALPEASRAAVERGDKQGGSSRDPLERSAATSSSRGGKKKSPSLDPLRSRTDKDSLTRLGESDEESQASSSRRGGAGEAGGRKRPRAMSSESEGSDEEEEEEEEDEGPVRRHGGRREGGDRDRVVLEISDSSAESGEEAEGGPLAQARHRKLWSDDEEEDEEGGGSEGEDSVARGEEPEQGEGQEEGEAEGESQESAIGHVTLDDEAARQFSRSKAVRGYAVDGGFIRGEGDRNAERVPQEVGTLIRAKGLDKLDKKTLASRIRGLVEECQQKLKRYKKRLRKKLEGLEDAAVRLARDGQRRAGVADALVGEVKAGLVWVEEEMRLFTRTTDDVLYYCMKRLRPADEEKYDALVEAFVQRHNGVDRVVKDSMADLRARVRRAVDGGGGGGWHELPVARESGGEGQEEGQGDESDDDVLLIDMSSAGTGEKRSRQAGGGSRVPSVSASSDRRAGEPARRRKGTGSGSGSGIGRAGSREGGGGRSVRGPERKRDSMDDFIVEDVRRRKRRRREDGGRSAHARPPRHSGDDVSGEAWEDRGQEDEGRQAPRQRRDARPRVDRGQPGVHQARGGRGGSRDGFGTDTGEEGGGDADEAFLFPLSDDEEGPRAGGQGPPLRGLPMVAPLGEDVEAALCHVKAAAIRQGHGGPEATTNFLPPLPPDFESTLWPQHPLDEDDTTVLGLPITIHESWMAEPNPVLSTTLLPRLLSHLSILASGPALATAADRLCKVKACFDVITAHLRAYAYRYTAQELADLAALLRQAGLEMERAFCRRGLIPHKDPEGSAAPEAAPADLPGLAPLLYHSLLDWFSHLSHLERQRQQAPSPASAFLPHLLTYVLHHLLAHSLQQPEALHLRLPPPLPSLEDTLRLFQRLCQPLPHLWCRVLDCLPTNGEVWPRLLHVTRAQLSTSPTGLGDEIRTGLINEELEQWTGAVSLSAWAAENRGGLQMDLATAEHLWRLLFDLIRLDMMHAHLRASTAPPRARHTIIGAGEEKEVAQGAWAIVELLLQNSPLSLKPSAKTPANQTHTGQQQQATWAERYARQICPHRYTMLLVQRLRGLIQAWGPPCSLTAEVWEALIQGAATRLLDPAGLQDLALVDRRTLLGGLGTRPGGMSAWRWLREAMRRGAFGRPTNPQADWSAARTLLWELADRRLCDKVDAFLFLPPPALLHDLQTGDAEAVVRRLVSKGCDEVLLLSSCLLERHMGCLASPDLRRTFLTGLISRLDSGGNAQLLGLHNLAMALLVLHHKGQAEQKVLVNFWRKLRGACLQGRTDTSGHMERALSLSIQFLAQMGPTTASQPDFLQPTTFLDNLVSWFNMTCRTPQEAEELAKKQLVPPPRYAPSLKWSLLYGLTLLLQVDSHSPASAPACPALGPLLTRLLLHYKDLDNPCLCLTLYAFRHLCPLPSTQALSPTCPLKLRLPLLPSPPASAALPPSPSTLSSWAPPAELLSTLNTLVREAWMGSSTLSEFNVDHCLSLPLHATASLRALACSLALHQACKSQSPQADCSLLRASLDCKPSTYTERSAGASQLRLFAPCFYDAYLPFYPSPPLLPTAPLLEGREWDVLASWLGVTVELALSSHSGREGVEQGHISGLAGADVLPDNRPLRHLRGERYWQLTSRLLATLRLQDEDGALLLDLGGLGREVPLGPGSRLQPLLQRLPPHERDLVLRLCLLANLFVNMAKALLHRLRSAPMPRRNQFKQRMVKLLSLLSGSLRLFAPVRSRKAESQGRKTPGGHAREFAYSVVSLLLRLCPDVAQEKLLDDLLPDLFGPLLLPDRREKEQAKDKERGGEEEREQRPAIDPAFAVQLASAVDRLGDVMCCLSQVRYSRDAVVSWMRHLCLHGLFLPGAPRSLQTRAFRALCHGLWHACPCHPSDADLSDNGTQDVRRAMQEVVRLNGQAALVQQIRQEAQPRVDAFRWRFLFELDLIHGLDPALAPAADPQHATGGLHGGRVLALLRLLRIFYSSFCLCGQTAPSTCVNNDIFPVLAPLARLLLLSLDPQAAVTQAIVEEAWTLVLSVLACPLPSHPPGNGNGDLRLGTWVREGGASAEETTQRIRSLLRSWIDLLMLIGAVRAGGYRLGEDDGLELLVFVEEARKRFVSELGRAGEARGRARGTVSRHLWGVERKVDWPTLLLASAVDLRAKGEELEALADLREAVRGGEGGGEGAVLCQRAAEALQQGLHARRS